MTPAEALDRHVELLMRLQDPWLSRVLQIFLERMYPESPEDSRAGVVQALINHVQVAQTYLIEGSMVKLAHKQMATRYTETEKFGDCVAPSGCGVLLCGEPLRSQELRGREELTHLVTWGPVRSQDASGLLMVRWNDARREPDEALLDGPEGQAYLDLVLRHGGLSPLDLEFWLTEDRIGPVMRRPVAEQVARVRAEGGEPVAAVLNVGRWMLGVWALMAETISASGAVRPPRHAARRAERAELAPVVNVVTLRHEAREVLCPGSGTPLQWRSPVSGHWRNQPCGPGRAEIRRIWISNHERGPADAPYRPTRGTVYRLAR